MLTGGKLCGRCLTIVWRKKSANKKRNKDEKKIYKEIFLIWWNDKEKRKIRYKEKSNALNTITVVPPRLFYKNKL